MKDKAILLGWIAGLLLLISLLWILTQNAQAFKLLRTVNNVFMSNNDSRRVSEVIQVKAGKAEVLGYWYLMYNSANKLFVFTAFQDGICIPLGAIVTPNGTVEEILPLSSHATQIFNTIPKSILQLYINKIENAVSINFAAPRRAAR
jgi:hypothetical protein